MSREAVLSEELRAQLGELSSTGDLVILSESKNVKAKTPKLSKLEEAIQNYKPRPEKAVPSMKKDQRMADEVKEVLKERKRIQQLQEKQQLELSKRQKRVELYERLQKVALSSQVRDELKTSSDLAKPISTTERQAGKVGERQRRKARRKRIGSDAGSGTRVFIPDNDDDDDDDDEDVDSVSGDNVAPKSGVSGLITRSELMEEENEMDEEEETGLPIPPTPSPVPELLPDSVLSRAPVPQQQQQKKIQSAVKNKATSPADATASADNVKQVIESPQPSLVVRPDRPADLAEARRALPVCGMEQEIVEAIKGNPVVFVCGETGSGKTTQIPQMLLEAGFGCLESKEFPGQVCVSQPRRVAATSVAERVGVELGCPVIRKVTKTPSRGNRYGMFADDLKGCVGFQIRHDADTVSADCTRIKFCTDGILLRECREDFLLRQYSCIVMDEVHERGLNSDLLLGLLSRIVPLREQLFKEGKTKVKPLKLVIMSATMDLDDFTRLGFESSPVIRIETRQHPVIPHFAKRTEQVDYLQATLKKTFKVHEKLPPGGVLVFLPGQREIEWFCKQLQDRYNNEDDNDDDDRLNVQEAEEERKATRTAIHDVDLVRLGEEDGDGGEEEEADMTEKDDDDEGYIPLSSSSSSSKNHAVNRKTTKAIAKQEKQPPVGKVKSTPAVKATEQVDENDFSDLEDETTQQETTASAPPPLPAIKQPVHVVPLYSRLSAAKQKLAFLPPTNPDARVIVVATNVAETSLTIPGIRYVVDCGREKRRVYDQRTGTSGFKVEWISQSSANQRMGRAGRTGPGHCYRLYSSAVFNDVFLPKSLPEIATVPIDDLVLYMKSMGIDLVQEFPFPTALDRHAVDAAVIRLKQLGVLVATKKGGGEAVTPLGASVAKLPTNVRIGKMLVVAALEPRFHSILPHLVSLGALLSLPSPFDSMASPAQVWRGDGSSDALALLRAAGAYSHSPTESFCAKHRLNIKTMREFEHLYAQLARSLSKLLKDELTLTMPKNFQRLAPMKLLTPEHEHLLRQSVVSGLLDRVARKMDPVRARAFAKSQGVMFPPRSLKDWPYDPSDPSLNLPALFIHSHSVLLPPAGLASSQELDHTSLPDFIAYSSVGESGRMELCTALDVAWLRALSAGTSLCVDNVSDTPEPFYDPKLDAVFIHIKPLFGPRGWTLPIEKIRVDDQTIKTMAGDVQKFLKAAVPAFARALLEGKVIGKFLEESKSTAPFAHCTRAQLQPRVAVLVSRLLKAEIVTKVKLLSKWKEDGLFLKQEIADHWVKPEERKAFENSWSAVVKKAVA